MKANVLGTAFSGLIFLLAIPSVAQPQSSPKAEGGCRLGSTTGAPYSAIQESTHSQTLADGTHIENKGVTVQIYRDSQGRTRSELYSEVGAAGAQEKLLRNITITDPVECLVYNLHVADHVAGRRCFRQSRQTRLRAPAGRLTPPLQVLGVLSRRSCAPSPPSSN